ncbi:hypothetical protein BO71DRAFT_149651 [Aspergillus ellipticus CBS 707.79]|uniref:Uncharacterized protein n=1 Tax=Aspergillus ellipticus CBS 707.79 TaxID=1448320 RepID=A0A319E039_9EURO|nr:hypothetical protein BO71DRAFT_149651 [Aspergillus ellipticus CBS 707.79]
MDPCTKCWNLIESVGDTRKHELFHRFSPNIARLGIWCNHHDIYGTLSQVGGSRVSRAGWGNPGLDHSLHPCVPVCPRLVQWFSGTSLGVGERCTTAVCRKLKCFR